MIWLCLAALLFCTDYFIKRKMEKDYPADGTSKKILGGKIVLRRMGNKGTAGGFLADKTEYVRLASTVIYGIFLVRFFILLFKKGRGFLKFSCALIAGGGLSNLYDRWVRGSVTDYFRFHCDRLKKAENLVFNLGDVFILTGGLFAFLYDLFHAEK